ncbi:MAG TPA: riboflavin synthase [Fimbriimonadaceae bacterium]|nr:riboflavin synthase [Fimbriimonadaceae bacterium]
MFTGIIQGIGTVRDRSGARLVVDGGSAWPASDTILAGESISVSGCCLTAVPGSSIESLRFDLSEETLRRTTLGRLDVGSRLNLERAMRPTDRFGGHIVQGHVDGTALCVGRTKASEGTVFRFQLGSGEERYLIDKGSIAIDGISLTVVRPSEGEFDVWIIPHTLAHTTLDDLIEGMEVHVEYDLIAKYVERLVGSRQ